MDKKLAEIGLLRSSPLFDRAYVEPVIGGDSSALGLPLEIIYLQNPRYWGMQTSPLFDGRYYLTENADVSGNGTNPLLHYLLHGFREGRAPSPVVDPAHIVAQLVDVDATDREALKAAFDSVLPAYADISDLLTRTGADPNYFFSNELFRRQLDGSPVAGAAEPPIAVYMRMRGRCEDRERPYLECTELASMAFYMEANPDLARAGAIPLAHLLQYGLGEGRRFSREERVRASFLTNTAHLLRRPELTRLDTFLRSTRARGHLPGPAWPTPYKEQPLASTAHRAPAGTTCAVGIVLYRNEDDELVRLRESLANEERIVAAAGHRLQVHVLANDPENAAHYVEVLGRPVAVSEEGNVGFGRAHNVLMREAFHAADLYVGTNPDGYFAPGCLQALVDASDFHGHSALIEAASLPMEHPKWYDPISLDTTWVSGACFALPRKLWGAVGGFDEQIHMYCEDIDLSWRVRLVGGLLKVCPTARFVHDVTTRRHAAIDPAQAVEQTRTRKRAMLMGAYYLARKWGSDERANTLRGEMSALGLLAAGEDPVEPTVQVDRAIARDIVDFDHERFAPSRFW